MQKTCRNDRYSLQYVRKLDFTVPEIKSTYLFLHTKCTATLSLIGVQNQRLLPAPTILSSRLQVGGSGKSPVMNDQNTKQKERKERTPLGNMAYF